MAPKNSKWSCEKRPFSVFSCPQCRDDYLVQLEKLLGPTQPAAVFRNTALDPPGAIFPCNHLVILLCRIQWKTYRWWTFLMCVQKNLFVVQGKFTAINTWLSHSSSKCRPTKRSLSVRTTSLPSSASKVNDWSSLWIQVRQFTKQIVSLKNLGFFRKDQV